MEWLAKSRAREEGVRRRVHGHVGSSHMARPYSVRRVSALSTLPFSLSILCLLSPDVGWFPFVTIFLDTFILSSTDSLAAYEV